MLVKNLHPEDKLEIQIMLYRVTFPAGFESLVTTLLRRDFPGSSFEGSLEDRSSCIVTIPQALPVKKPAYAQSWAPVLDNFSAPHFQGACEILSGVQFSPRYSMDSICGDSKPIF